MSTPPIVIVVEPAPMISDVLRVEFSCLGFAVLLAANGQQAEAFAAQTTANLVLLDVSAMKLSGYAACARIRRFDGYLGTPIIMTANEISPQDVAAAETAGANALLCKPYSMVDLIKAVSPHLAPNDPLLWHPSRAAGMAETPLEWKPEPKPTWHFGADSGLSRNGTILSVVRGSGKKIPIYRKP